MGKRFESVDSKRGGELRAEAPNPQGPARLLRSQAWHEASGIERAP
jgi:hypothetical protein